MNREESLKQAKPILFNTEMVKAILDGRKTQTRRVVPIRLIDNYYAWCEHLDSIFNGPIQTLDKVDRSPKRYFQNSAKYKTGDILYVRETWTECHIASPDKYLYRADYDTNKYPYSKWSWRPSIHMPKEAARIFLRVTNVRVERLQDITLQDVLNEGVKLSLKGTVEAGKDGAIQPFQKLWDSTVKDHGTYGWDANPYVWVIEFERVTE